MSATLLLLALLLPTLALSTTLPHLSRQRSGCVLVKTTYSVAKKRCGRKRVIATLSFNLSVSPARTVGTVTLRCLDKRVAKEVAVRTKKCITLLLGRCKCLRDSRKSPCIDNQIKLCAGNNSVDLE